jgi:hypothetical protein
MFVFNGNEATSGAWVFMDKPDIDRLIEGLQQAREQLL